MLPIIDLTKRLIVKIGRSFFGIKPPRMVWTVAGVSDAVGPADNVRNYLERRQLRSILKDISAVHPIGAACEVGCGYGRIIMILKEFADRVVGFEREPSLISIAQSLLPGIEICQCNSLDQISKMGKGQFDFVMTLTVLQHLTDDFCQKVIEEIKMISPNGYVLLTEKTEAIRTTENVTDGSQFISRARPVEFYKKWMAPFVLVKTLDRVLEQTYGNPKPGTHMLFKSPLLD